MTEEVRTAYGVDVDVSAVDSNKVTVQRMVYSTPCPTIAPCPAWIPRAME